MKRILILERESLTGYKDIKGQSILDLPETEVVLFAERRRTGQVAGIANVTVEGFTWKQFADGASLREKAEFHHRQKPFDAVATLDELLIEVAAGLREALGIAGLSPAQARRYRDKVEMKRIVGDSAIRVPEFSPAIERNRVEMLLETHGKLVLKPCSEAGSRHVAFIDTKEALADWYSSTRDPGRFEAEEFIEGTLYHLDSVVRDGQICMTACAEYVPGMGNIDFTDGTPFTSYILNDSALRRRFEKYASEVIGALEFENGVTHLECFLTESGEIVFCEIGIRPGGGGIVGMTEAQYGVNLSRAALLLELGMDNEALADIHERKDVTFGLAGLRDAKGGFVRVVPELSDFSDPWIENASILVNQGDFRPPCEHCTDFVARFIFTAEDRDDYLHKLDVLEQRFRSGLEIEAL
ncbi:MAG: ATP-grasp domain-containing protein [Parvularculaceae bacterium]